MPRFRNKPVVVDAVRVLPASLGGDGPAGPAFSDNPEWMKDARRDRRIVEFTTSAGHVAWSVWTLGGMMIARIGDWIIRGIRGELYTCKSDIFEATYERVEDTDA
jgi:hypothetical protein